MARKQCLDFRRIDNLADMNCQVMKEVSTDVIQSEYFVGYEFKKSLLVVQQAITIWCMM